MAISDIEAKAINNIILPVILFWNLTSLNIQLLKPHNLTQNYWSTQNSVYGPEGPCTYKVDKNLPPIRGLNKKIRNMVIKI